MVDRCKINFKGCLVVDLDGTLIKGNSLVILADFLFKRLLKTGRLSQAFTLLKVITLRKLKFISHKKMKYRISELVNKFLSPDEIKDFSKILFRNKNEEVFKMINGSLLQGNKVLIATASIDFFMKDFIQQLDNSSIDYIGTPFSLDFETYSENRSEVKLHNVEEYLKLRNLHCISVISDHYDDLPLFKKFPGNNYLINPDTTTLNKLRENIPGIEFEKVTKNIFLLRYNFPADDVVGLF